MKFLNKLNLKKTWPYLSSMFVLEIICILVLLALCYGVEHYQEFPTLMETVDWYGYTFTYRDLCAILIWFLVLKIFFAIPVFLWKFFYELVIKNMRKDDNNE